MSKRKSKTKIRDPEPHPALEEAVKAYKSARGAHNTAKRQGAPEHVLRAHETLRFGLQDHLEQVRAWWARIQVPGAVQEDPPQLPAGLRSSVAAQAAAQGAQQGDAGHTLHPISVTARTQTPRAAAMRAQVAPQRGVFAASSAPPPPAALQRTALDFVPASLRALALSGVPGTLVLGMVGAEAGLLMPPMHYLRPEGSLLGWPVYQILAVMIPAAEIAVGLTRAKLRAAGKSASDALVLIAALAALQVGFSYLSEQAAVYSVTMTATQAANKSTQTSTQCKRQEMPANLGPERIDSWNAGGDQREKEYENCRTFEANLAKQGVGDMVAAASKRLWWEKWLIASASGVVSAAIGVCSGALNDTLLALLAIPTALVMGFGRLLAPLRRLLPRAATEPHKEPDPAPVVQSTGWEVIGEAGDPPAREPLWSRIAYAPLRLWRRITGARSAA